MGDNVMNTSVVQALDALNIKEWTLQGKEPTNENEFNANFHKVIGEDETGSQIWENDPSKWDVTWSQVQAKQTEMDSDWIVQEYARKREAAYPSTGDQLDYIYHNGVAKWKTDMIDPVKTKYPKG
jgi:hypothetical protein